MQATQAPAPETAPAPADKSRPKLWHNIAVRLADEGVPVKAITRALMMPHPEVREVLNDAVARGTILAVPREDWPTGTRRDERVPDTVPLEAVDEHMIMLVMRTFKFTPTMARMFVALLRRPEMTKPALHLVTQPEGASPEEPTEMKIVDVYVCKMRKKLPPEIVIETIWGRGYAISKAGKKIALEMLGLKQEQFAVLPAGAEGAATPGLRG